MLTEGSCSEFHRIFKFCLSARRDATHYVTASSLRAALSLWRLAVDLGLMTHEFGQQESADCWFRLLAREDLFGTEVTSLVNTRWQQTAGCSFPDCTSNLVR